MKLIGILVLLGVFPSAAFARPFISYRGIVHGASYAPSELPNGSIARGSIFSIFGRGLGPATGIPAPALPLTQELSGVSIEVCQGAQCLAAYPLFVAAGQINAIMPSNAPLGAVNLRVTYNGEAGNYSPVRVSASNFGVFSVLSSGFGPGIVTNFVSAAEQPLNSAQTSARPGSFVTVWGTGLGAALNADNVAPQAGDLPVEVEIWIGGVPVTNKLYSGRSPEFPGLDQVVLELPSSVPTGCYVPVVLRVARQTVSNSTTIAIAANGSPCADPATPLRAARGGGRVGVAMLHRILNVATLPASLGLNFTSDLASAIFQNEATGAWHFNRLYSLPPPGTCTTYTASSSDLDPDVLAGLAASGATLNAGPQLSVAGPVSTGNVPRLAYASNSYGAFLGTDLTFESPIPLFFGSGTHRVSGPGGGDVGAFEVNLAAPPALTWTNRDTFASVVRGTATEATWTGGDAQGLVVVFGIGNARTRYATAGFLCVERAAVGRVSIPEWATAHFPAGRANGADGIAGVVALPAAAATFNAAGLDFGYGLFTAVQMRGTEFR